MAWTKRFFAWRPTRGARVVSKRYPAARVIRHPRTLSPPHAALIYTAVACTWILLTDLTIGWVPLDQLWSARLQTLKGWGFVLATAVWLYVLVRREHDLRHQVEETEREAAELLGTFLGSAPIAIIALDRQGQILLWNTAAERLFGWAATEVLGLVVSSIPAGQGNEERYLRELLQIGKPLAGAELVRRRKDGSAVDVAVWTASLRDKSGTVSGTVIAISDISGLRVAQAESQRQLERLSSLRLIDQAITEKLDLNVTLEVVLHEAVDRLGVDAAAILLFSGETEVLEFAVGIGFQSDALRDIRIRTGDGIAGATVLGRRTLHMKTLEDPRVHGNRRPGLLEEGFVVHYATPLMVRGKVLGVLEVFHRAPLSPDRDWVEFLETLGGQAAIAVENTVLFEELQQSNAQLTIAYDATLEGWSGALDLRDEETEGHAQRVTAATILLARAMGMSEEDLVHLRRGALLHDIGKMGVPDSILRKPGPLTDDEWEIMRRHPVYAYELLSPITFLHPALDIPYCHHEKWDGTGYPRGLKGEEIPIAARIFAVVDVWDALLSDRPYRSRLAVDEVISYIESRSGTDFDPAVVREFMQMVQRLPQRRVRA